MNHRPDCRHFGMDAEMTAFLAKMRIAVRIHSARRMRSGIRKRILRHHLHIRP